MRISDWSSDVCSSDLGDEWRHRAQARRGRAPVVAEPPRRQRPVHGHGLLVTVTAAVAGVPAFLFGQLVQGCHDHLASGGLEVAVERSEERRVGKECVRTGRSRGLQDDKKKKKK